MRVTLLHPAHPSFVLAAIVGVLLGCAVLTHLSHVLACGFVIAVFLDDPRGRGAAMTSIAIALLVGGVIAGGAYAYAAFVVRGHHSEGALRWVLSATHGFVEPRGPYSLAGSVYGFCRAFVWSPLRTEPDPMRLIGQLLLGLIPVIAVTAIAIRHRGALAALPMRAFFWLILPYSLLGLVFFGADTERWLFIVPVLLIVAATAFEATRARREWSLLFIACLAALNFALGVWPAHRDTRARVRAELAASVLSDGDLVIFPGHDWDEYITFYAAYGGKRVEPFPLVYYIARDGEARTWSRLDREIGAATARGHAVFAVRLFNEASERDDAPGYVELRAIGVSRIDLDERLRHRFAPRSVLEQDGTVVYRLSPR